MEPPPRIVTLVLVTPEGRLVGSLAPFTVDVPWWQEAGLVVNGAREHHGVDVTLLRLLDSERPTPHGGAVTYLAEVAEPVPAAPWAGSLDGIEPSEHPYHRSDPADWLLRTAALLRSGSGE